VSAWPAATARLVLAALVHIGWSVNRLVGLVSCARPRRGAGSG
jgi:hypothetical protein